MPLTNLEYELSQSSHEIVNRLPVKLWRPKKFILGIIALVILVGATGAWFAYRTFFGSQSLNNKHESALTVTTCIAARKPITRRLHLTGPIAAWDPLAVGAEMNGLRIDSILVEEGQHVKSGQILAKLNALVLQAQLAKERGVLAENTAKLKKAVQPSRPEELEKLKDQLQQAMAGAVQQGHALAHAKAVRLNAEIASSRYSGLAKLGAVSQQDADDKRTQAEVTLADEHQEEQKVKTAQYLIDQAKQNLNEGLTGGYEYDIEMAKAALVQSQATVRQLEAQVAQTVIKAPADGLIIKRDAHIGDITTQGKDLFIIARDSRLEFKAKVPEAYLLQFQPGQTVSIQGADLTNKTIGTVREISPQVEDSTRLGTVRIDIPHAAKFVPGMFAEGVATIGHDTVLSVPSQAIVIRDDTPVVFIIKGDKVSLRQLEVGTQADGVTEVKDGLAEGEVMALDGAALLKDGDIVTIGNNNTKAETIRSVP